MGQGKPSGRKILKDIFRAAVDAASPKAAIEKNLTLIHPRRRPVLKINNFSYSLDSINNIYLIGAGKAAPGMARAVEAVLGNLITGGCVVTKYGHGRPLKRVEVIEAGHPIPDGNGLKGAQRILDIAGSAGKDDLVIFLLSGGASALLPAPAQGLTLKDKQLTTALLLRSGATINEMNAVRKHLSSIKGGMLARAAYPARVITLIISDVVGSDISTIGSGPAAPDETAFKDALAVLKKYGLIKKTPASVILRLTKGAKGLLEETPKPKDALFKSCDNTVIADNLSALRAARKKAESFGLKTIILTSRLSGETHEAARLLSSILKEIKSSGNPIKPPACVLAGGETTLEIKGKGLGGRNQELALVAALELLGTKGITILSAGTDGTDGPTDAAGAFGYGSIIKKALKAGLDPESYLKANDSYNFFKAIGGLFKIGPTGTNVMDIVIGVVE